MNTNLLKEAIRILDNNDKQSANGLLVWYLRPEVNAAISLLRQFEQEAAVESQPQARPS